MNRFLVTITPPTPNGDLHIGHIAGPFLGADVFTRVQRQQGHDCVLVSYSDDYQSYMLRRGMELDRNHQALAEENTQKMCETLELVGIHVDNWMQPRHNRYFLEAVTKVYEAARNAGAIYSKTSSEPYCSHCDKWGYEAFGRGLCNHCGVDSDASQCEGCAHKAVRFREALRKAESWTEINGIMQNAVSRYGEFNEGYLLAASLPQEVAPDSYVTWLVNEMVEDLNESITGVTHSPVKAANEVWRNCRHQLRILMDDSGLSDSSRAFFYTRYAPVINRLVAGPQKERHQELLALIHTGVVKPLHPDVTIHRRYDHVIQALIRSEKPGLDMPALVKKMARKGLLTIKTSGRSYVDVRADGRPSALSPGVHLWVFGPLCEGATYYNHYVPSPVSFSRSSNDADCSIRELLFPGELFLDIKIPVPVDHGSVSLSDKNGSSEIQL